MKSTTSKISKSGVDVVTKPRVPLKHVDDSLHDIMYDYIDVAKVVSFSDEQAKSATNLIRKYIYWVQTYIQFLAYEKDICYCEHHDTILHETIGGQETLIGEACLSGARDDVQYEVMKEIAPAYFHQFDVKETDRKLSGGESEFLDEVGKHVGNILSTLEDFISVLSKSSSGSDKLESKPTEIIHKTGDFRVLANLIRQ